MLLDERPELPCPHRQAEELRLGGHRRDPRDVVEETDLPEVISRPERCLPLAVDGDRSGAFGDDEEREYPRTTFTLVRDDRAGGKRVRPNMLGEAGKVVRLEACQERDTAPAGWSIRPRRATR